MFSKKRLAILGFAIGAAASASAQSGESSGVLPRAEIAVNYSYLRANATPGECGCFSLNGGSTEIAVHAYKHFSAVFDLTGDHAATTSVPGQSLSLLSYTAGPRYSHLLHRYGHVPVVPFVQGVVGQVRGFDAPFPRQSRTANSATALAVLAGGGVDVDVSRRLSIRVVQVDYGLNHLPNNSGNSENMLRVSAGLVFRLR